MNHTHIKGQQLQGEETHPLQRCYSNLSDKTLENISSPPYKGIQTTEKWLSGTLVNVFTEFFHSLGAFVNGPFKKM